MTYTVSLTAVVVIGAASTTASASPDDIVTIVTDTQKAPVETVVRASISVSPSLTGRDVTVFAPSGTDLWFDKEGACALRSRATRAVLLTGAQLDGWLCWRANEEMSGRLMARVTAPNSPTKWFAGPVAEFRNRWINPSFLAGVFTTLLTALLTLFAAFGQQMFSEWRENKNAQRSAQAEAERKSTETRLQVQGFLAQEFFPSIASWRQTLDEWRPDSGIAPPKLGLSGTYAGTKPERAAKLATYFAEVNQAPIAEDLKDLHTLGTKYNRLAALLNVPTPTVELEKQELEQHKHEAAETAERLRGRLAKVGF